MEMRRASRTALMIVVAGILAGIVVPASARASQGSGAPSLMQVAPLSPAAIAKADSEGFLIVPSSAGITNADGATFYPTGAIAEETLVVIAERDGRLPGGLDLTDLRQMVIEKRKLTGRVTSGATGTAAITAIAGMPRAYTAKSTAMSQAFTGQNIWGWDRTARVGYSFNVAIDSQQVNLGQGLGWYRGYLGSTYGTWSKWYNLGSTDADSLGGATVPWGEVIATAKFRARCAATTTCWGSWAP